MTTREFEDLTNQYLDNEISQENLLRLKRAIAGSELLRTHFNQACKLHVAEKRAMCARKKPVRTMSRGSHFSSSSARVRENGDVVDGDEEEVFSEELQAEPMDESSTESREHSAVPHAASLQELTRWEEEHHAQRQSQPRRSFSKHSTPKGEARPRKIYWLFPFWMLFVVATMGYIVVTLPEKIASPEENQKLNDADQRAFTLSERSNLPTPNVSIPTANASIALAETRAAEASEASATTRRAAAVQNAVTAPVTGDRPVQTAAVEHVTALIPTTLQDVNRGAHTAEAQSPAPQSTTSSVQGDEASMRLENALTDLFQPATASGSAPASK